MYQICAFECPSYNQMGLSFSERIKRTWYHGIGFRIIIVMRSRRWSEATARRQNLSVSNGQLCPDCLLIQ